MIEWGCVWVVVFLILFWGTVAWTIYHPPGIEYIPWFIAGVSAFLIFLIYKREK